MKTTSVSQLKASLSHYLHMIKNGEEVIITDRGRAIGKLVPLNTNELNVPTRLIELQRAGLVRIGKEALPEGFWQLPRPNDPEELALKALQDERDEE